MRKAFTDEFIRERGERAYHCAGTNRPAVVRGGTAYHVARADDFVFPDSDCPAGGYCCCPSTGRAWMIRVYKSEKITYTEINGGNVNADSV